MLRLKKKAKLEVNVISFFLSHIKLVHRPCFHNKNHNYIDPLSCSLKRLRASMKMSNFERKYCPEYRHMICIGKTKSTSEKGLLSEFVSKSKNGLKANFFFKINSFLR